MLERTTKWIRIGATVGAVLAVLAITDARHFLPLSWGITDRVDFLMCWWMILGFGSWSLPIAFFYLMVIILIMASYALLFLVIGLLLQFAERYSTKRRRRDNIPA